MTRLHICNSGESLAGFTRIDRREAANSLAFKADDWDIFYPNESVNEILAEDVLQYFSSCKTGEILREFARVLKPGRKLTIKVPDARSAMIASLNGQTVPLETFLMGTHSGDDVRASIYDEAGLREDLHKAGFEDIRRIEGNPLELVLSAQKSEVFPVSGVWAVQSFPRYGSTQHFASSLDALVSLGITGVSRWGVYWEGSFTRAIESAIEQKPKYILAVDYDTLFSASQVRSLYRLMENHPEADAIFSLQMKREDSHPLFFIRDENGKTRKSFTHAELDSDLLRCDAGHFGCTIFRAERFARTPRPWLWSQPDPDGRWEGGRVDADIFFWKQWASGGNSAYLAPRVPVGHLQEFAIWPDREFRVVHQSVTDYRKHGMPAGVRR